MTAIPWRGGAVWLDAPCVGFLLLVTNAAVRGTNGRDTTLTDEAVIARVREGERELFEGLVERYKRGIANFIGAGVRDSAEVADLSQETFMRAYAHLGTFNPKLRKFSTWIYQIARNVVRTHLGKSLRRPA